MEKDLVEYIAKPRVDAPDEVQVHMVEGEQSTIIELKVAQSDVGKVIGKSGRIANAVRVILNASAAKNNKHIQLEILD